MGATIGLLVQALFGGAWTAVMLFGLPLGIVAAPVSLSAWYLCRALPLSRTSALNVVVTSVGAADHHLGAVGGHSGGSGGRRSAAWVSCCRSGS